MLDKIEMRSKELIDLKIFQSTFPDFQLSRMNDLHYGLCLRIKKNNTEIIKIKTNPIWGSDYQTKIIVNPKNWVNFDALKTSLANFSDLDQFEITRLDHAVDLKCNIDYIYRRLRIKFKQKSTMYDDGNYVDYNRGVITGFYIGKLPELYNIYDKIAELKKKKRYNQINLEDGPLTRIELRQTKDKIKHKSLKTIFNYLEEPPFKEIEFYEPNENAKYPARAERINNFIEKEGLHNAYFNLNDKNNFKRDYLKYLTPSNFQETLNHSYIENLRHFLGDAR